MLKGDVDIREINPDQIKRRASPNDKEMAKNIAKGSSTDLFIKC